MHGDEPKSVYLVRGLIERLSIEAPGCSVVVVAAVNPDGYARRRRRNANGVDLNRNFPTADWMTGPRRSRHYAGPQAASEPETRAVLGLVESLQPARVVSVHSISRHRHCNNYDGPANLLAEEMARWNGYPVRDSIGYPTLGSLGTWAGVERGLATVTLELPSHHSPQRCLRENIDALVAACRWRLARGRRGRA